MRRRSEVVRGGTPTHSNINQADAIGAGAEVVTTTLGGDPLGGPAVGVDVPPSLAGVPFPEKPVEIRAASAPLAAELKKPAPLPMRTANGVGARPGELAPDMHALVERVFRKVPLDKEYDELEGALTLGEGRNDRGTLRKALDEAEEKSRRAFHLYLDARLEQEKWLADQEVVQSALRKKASEALEDEKARGERKKAITEADVVAEVAERYPDEARHYRLEKLRIKGTVESMEHLADRWKSKCLGLRTLLETAR